MTKYIIKVTYLEGQHAGKEYYLGKGGYVCPNLEYVWQNDSYTLPTCKSVCKRYTMQNEINNRVEKREREYRIAQGKPVSPYMIYDLQKFEPFAIETVDR